MEQSHSKEHIENSLKEAEKLKNEGNDFFTQQNFKKALRKYKFMSLYLNGLEDSAASVISSSQPSKKTLEEIKKSQGEDSTAYQIAFLRFLSLNNQAICYLKLKNPEKAMKAANQAIAFDPDNTKALLRRFQAAVEIGDSDCAKNDFNRLSELLKDDATIKHLSQQLAACEKKQLQKEKSIYSKLFSQ